MAATIAVDVGPCLLALRFRSKQVPGPGAGIVDLGVVPIAKCTTGVVHEIVRLLALDEDRGRWARGTALSRGADQVRWPKLTAEITRTWVFVSEVRGKPFDSDEGASSVSVSQVIHMWKSVRHPIPVQLNDAIQSDLDDRGKRGDRSQVHVSCQTGPCREFRDAGDSKLCRNVLHLVHHVVQDVCRRLVELTKQCVVSFLLRRKAVFKAGLPQQGHG
mmetsp:Transcript_55429/g.130089  ORF Transcript_55429/g.130089 Transcript_55429/m.130089 type:complete len:217 (-) Transcript_55429:173-823(-)